MQDRMNASPWVRPMAPRDPNEPHRVSTPLELLFDLCFVVAVSYASNELHHGLAEGHYDRILGYGMVFFAIWWAWLNFAWFASAYDTDDVPYRLTVLVKIAGVLLVAAGVPAACDARDFAVVTVGYTLMRVALVAQWLRASRGDPPRAKTIRRYAGGIVALQLCWLALLVVPHGLWLVGWCVLLPAELLLPVWAERAGETPWHRHHIAERYGLLTLIVLGESVLSATTALRTAVEAHSLSAPMLGLIAGSLLILFTMWWIYFEHDGAELLERNPGIEFVWGYGHLVIFASAAAVGAGLGVAVDALAGHTHLPQWALAAPVAVPVALFLFSVWLLQIRLCDPGGRLGIVFGVTGVLVILCSCTIWGVLAIGLLLAALVAWMVHVHGLGGSEPHLHT
jgi:low temperature requirement protein LtrA